MVTNVSKRFKTVETITCDLSDFLDIVYIDTVENIQEKLKEASNVMSWYNVHMMQANPTKFQYIICRNDIYLNLQSCIKLLGVYIDGS